MTRRRLAVLALALPFLLGFGINSPVDDVDRAFAAGRFGEMAHRLEARIGPVEKASTFELVHAALCTPAADRSSPPSGASTTARRRR